MPTKPLVTSYRQDLKLFPDRWHKVGMVLIGALVLAFPFVADDRWLTIGNLAWVSIVGSVALMVLTGFSGQISLGHAAFLALGAYTAAVLGNLYALPFWLVLPIAGLVAAGVGLAAGVFALRLKGLYLAIVTLGLVFIVNHVLLSFPDYTRGLSGTSVPMYLWFEGADGTAPSFAETWELGPVELPFERKLYFLYLLLAAGTAWIATNLTRSGAGRAMMAVRDHDIAASALGVNPSRAKILSFGISSFLAGVAGAMFAWQQQYITVDPPFNLLMSVQYIAMIVLGGLGTVFGAVAGAVAFVVLTPLAEDLGSKLPLVDQLTSAQRSIVLFSLLVMGFLVFEPLGLYGIWLRIKRYFAAWPFRY